MMSIADAFNQSAENYDQLRYKLIPCYDLFYGTALDLIPKQRDESFRVLYLGAGTGLLAGKVRERFPNCTIDLVDIAGDMLEQAKLRLGENQQTRYFHADYLQQPLPGEYDIILSALSLHHCSVAQLNMMFSKIYAATAPGGVFINADQQLGVTEAIEQNYQQRWLDAVRQNGCSEQEIAAALERMQYDKTQPLTTQLNLLEAKGFRQVCCWFQHFRFCVYSAEKPLKPFI